MADSLFLLQDELIELAGLLDMRADVASQTGQGNLCATYRRLRGATLRASSLVDSLIGSGGTQASSFGEALCHHGRPIACPECVKEEAQPVACPGDFDATIGWNEKVPT